MPTSINTSLRIQSQANFSFCSHTTFDRSTTSQHLCPCCSYVLLRHVRLDGVYWRCSHCHAEMAVWRSA
ncbi:hypothetical protein [Leptolyngbya boryana]|uniref:hypothetical protein n=1 Tax=Leptolyngbya boryana TaxID=1184 RepID=UPI0008FC1737|nr:hypothetical protein [Leptolyngbya boryana]MBD2368602.1 hypothetical protein [Leptolyngbya sp. FACHB-161]MBD2375137.1 hypothetical protein [Leptolyngbya sp. FACHB-238]MBD2399556.1 hypothetical protein [Leptolyngbya sp. FACHB-239]ULP28579.1 hypothetical protein MCP04_21540 [Leptolyngbya boryana IU 594]